MAQNRTDQQNLELENLKIVDQLFYAENAKITLLITKKKNCEIK